MKIYQIGDSYSLDPGGFEIDVIPRKRVFDCWDGDHRIVEDLKNNEAREIVVVDGKIYLRFTTGSLIELRNPPHIEEKKYKVIGNTYPFRQHLHRYGFVWDKTNKYWTCTKEQKDDFLFFADHNWGKLGFQLHFTGTDYISQSCLKIGQRAMAIIEAWKFIEMNS